MQSDVTHVKNSAIPALYNFFAVKNSALLLVQLKIQQHRRAYKTAGWLFYNYYASVCVCAK